MPQVIMPGQPMPAVPPPPENQFVNQPGALLETPTAPTDDHSSLILGGLGGLFTTLCSVEPETHKLLFHLNLGDPLLWVSLGATLHGFGVNLPILDRLFGFASSLFAKKV